MAAGDEPWVSEPAGRLGKALDLEKTWGWLGFAVRHPAIRPWDPRYCGEGSPIVLTVVSAGCVCVSVGGGRSISKGKGISMKINLKIK